MADPSPRFHRCSWCASYFEVARDDGQVPDILPKKPCCIAELATFHVEPLPLSAKALNPADSSQPSPEDIVNVGEFGNLGKDSVDGQSTAKVWQRCPICHKAVHTKLIGKFAEYCSVLQIHLEHTRSDKKQSLLQQHPQQKSLDREIEPHTKGLNHPKQIFSGMGQKTDLQKIFLRNWYPDPADCHSLFWYSYALQ